MASRPGAEREAALVCLGGGAWDAPPRGWVNGGETTTGTGESAPPPGIEGGGAQQQPYPPPRQGAGFQQAKAQHHKGQEQEIGIGIEGHAPHPPGCLIGEKRQQGYWNKRGTMLRVDKRPRWMRGQGPVV